jgi:Tol biopolymer transport system component
VRKVLSNVSGGALLGTAITVCTLIFHTAPAASANEIAYTKGSSTCPLGWCRDVWTASADGSGAQVVVDGAGNPRPFYSPSLSSDGSLIAVHMHDYNTLKDYIYIYTSDGVAREIYGDLNGPLLGDSGGDFPRFSPNGRTIVYSGDALKGRGIFTLLRGTAERNLIVDWGREQIDATFSPDGSKIAFASSVNPQGEFHSKFKPGEPHPFQVYIANASGTSPVRLTSSDFEWALGPRFSHDSQRLVFVGKKTKGSGKGEGLFTIKVDGSEAVPLTSGPDRSPDWSPDGSKIVFKRLNDGIYTINPDGSGLTEVIHDTDSHDPTYRQPRTNINYGDLLEQYAPQVRYEAQESFYADSASMITDNPGNHLRREDSSVIAARSVIPFEPLNFSFLGYPNYANATSAFDSDFLDEDDDDYAGDAQQMRSDPQYADRAYGRAALAPDGKWWLQYWLFYYYNDQEVLGFGVHEGDWELVQIGLDQNGAPDVAAYAQHRDGEHCEWSNIERVWIPEGSTGRYAPVLYSARSSHASYFHAGTYRDGLDPAPDDHATGNGIIAAPSMVPISSADPWIAWPGRWGASGSSPDGPLHNEGGSKWTDPSTWAGELSDCGTVSFSAASAQVESPVPEPEVEVSRKGRNAVFDYSFAYWPRNPEYRPRFVVLTIDPAGRSSDGVQLSPLSYTHRLTGRQGRVVQPLGLGAGPFKALASAFSKRGVRSGVVVERLP